LLQRLRGLGKLALFRIEIAEIIGVRSANRIFILFVSAIKLTPSRKEVRGDGEAAEWRA
jgi:hypothetical protein